MLLQRAFLSLATVILVFILANQDAKGECVSTSPLATLNPSDYQGGSQCADDTLFSTVWRGGTIDTVNVCEGDGNHPGVDVLRTGEIRAVAEGKVWKVEKNQNGRCCHTVCSEKKTKACVSNSQCGAGEGTCSVKIKCRDVGINDFGNHVVLKHEIPQPDGTIRVYFSSYLHLKFGSIPGRIQQGVLVTCGERLGEVGNTGCTQGSTGTHLHFQIDVDSGESHPTFCESYNATPNDCVSQTTINPLPNLVDQDGDGASATFGDCNDANASIHPKATENCSNGIDDNCNGQVDSNDPACSSAQFDFAVGFLTVDGNILGRGNPDNVFDFFDNFNDGSLATPPTSSFFFLQPVEESGGFLRLKSADGTFTTSRFGFTILEDDAFLLHLLRNGAGNSEITASFRADPPAHEQYYGIGTVNPGSGSSLVESVAVAVRRGGDGNTYVAVNDHTGTIIALDRVTLPAGGFILLRLFVNDTINQMIASYSVNNGAMFIQDTQFDSFTRHGTIFNSTSTAFIFTQGGVIVTP